MYIDIVPNRNSPPCILLRESFREDGKVRKRTLANLTKLPDEMIDALRTLLRGGVVIENLKDSFQIRQSQPWGHIAAVLGTVCKLGLDRILATRRCLERQLVIAMIVARILDPRSKLATARGLGKEAHLSALTQTLQLPEVDEDQLYAAMDWLGQRQEKIEQQFAKKHLKDGSLVLYDITSTYFEGNCCPLAKRGYSRDGKKDKLQIVFGLLCNAQGCPVAVEVFDGNTADPKTLQSQIHKVRERFGLERVVFVGDRGMLTSARIDEEFRGIDGLDWISALRSAQINKLVPEEGFQYSLFDEKGFIEIQHPDFPGERLMVCYNPLLAQRRAQKREDLLKATEVELDKVVQATQRSKWRLKGQDKIGVRVGRILNRFKVAKHFDLHIEDENFFYHRRHQEIKKEARLDGIYVVRTSVPEQTLSAEEAVRSYKGLSVVERAFRSFKTVDLHVRPIHHRLERRVRAHVFLCMLAYYVEWHMRQKLAPLLFDDEDKEQAQAQRDSVVDPAQRSPSAEQKARTKTTQEGIPVHSFQTLLAQMALVSKDIIQPTLSGVEPFEKLSTPTSLQQRVLELLGVRLG